MSLMQQAGQMMGFGGDKLVMADIVPLKFFLKYVPDLEAVEVNGKTIYKDTGKLKAYEWVEWHKKLTGTQTIPVTCVQRVDRIKFGAKRATEPDDEAAAIWRTLEPYYNNWKSGGTEEVVNGTPLAVWAGVTADVVELLKPFRVLSVEDLSMIGDALMQKLPHPNIQMFKQRAIKFLATKDIAAAVRDLDNSNVEIAALREQVAALQKAQANSDFRRKEAESELDEAAPAGARKRRSKAEAA
jgi:hypothetical protein